MAQNRSGTTLLEILVTVSVVSLLLAIVVPSLTGAKRAARRVACAQNLRSIALGLILYTNDGGGTLPPTAQRLDEKEGADLSANILFHRDLGFDMPSLLRLHVSAKALNCPEPTASKYETPGPAISVVYSNYLFLWGAVNGTPEEGYERMAQAPPWATAVLDLTWNMFKDGRMLYGGNHMKTGFGSYEPTPFIASEDENPVGMQYNLSTLRPIYGMNAAFFDGSAQWVRRQRDTWRDAGPFDQAAFRASRVYLPARHRRSF